jgi:hypothetical protein
VVVVLVGLVIPGALAPAVRWYVLLVGALAVGASIREITARFPIYGRSAFDQAERGRPPAAEPPGRLREIERLVSYAAWDVFDAEARMRPLLCQIAAHRLAVSRAIDLEADPDAARAELGERVWNILTPADPSPQRPEPPITLDELQVVVSALERLDGLSHD